MKILFVSNGSNFLGAGGMEYHLFDISNWMEKKGVETALAVRKETFLCRVLLRGRPRVYPLSWTGIGKIVSFFELARAIRDFSPDIISINRERDIVRVFFISKMVGFFMTKKTKIVSVFHTLGWKGCRKLMAKLDGLIFPNNYTKNSYLSRVSNINKPVAVIYHGISLPNLDPTKKFDITREKRFFKNIDFPIIGMIGELRKNQVELIEVAKNLRKLTDKFTIAIIGRGTDDAIRHLHKRIEEFSLSQHFIITGGVERRLIFDILYDLDISVTTFRADAFGIAYIESLASYTPLVAYDSGGPVEILQKGGGVLVSGGPEEMALEIYRLLIDHKRRKSLGLEGRAVAERYFSIDAMGEQHYKFYANILGLNK